jgi:hypothetical protein
MWYHPGAHSVTKKDVIAAWLVCSLILVSFFIGTVLAANLAIASCLVDAGQEGKANSVLIHDWVGP